MIASYAGPTRAEDPASQVRARVWESNPDLLTTERSSQGWLSPFTAFVIGLRSARFRAVPHGGGSVAELCFDVVVGGGESCVHLHRPLVWK